MRKTLLVLLALLALVLFAALVLAQSPPVATTTPEMASQVKRLSDAAWVAIGAMVASVVTSIAGLIVALSTKKQTAEIHTMTNANLTAANAARDTAAAALKAANDMIAQLRLEKSDTAAAQAAKDSQTALDKKPEAG